MSNKCERYGIAITNYVLGEDLMMPAEELFAHLRSCKKCLKELTDWRDTYAVMRMESYQARPDDKEKMERMLEELNRQVFGLPAQQEINQAAQKIYDCIKTNGKIAIPILRKKTELEDYPFYEAMGVLITNSKVIVDIGKNKRPISASPLKPERLQVQI